MLYSLEAARAVRGSCPSCGGETRHAWSGLAQRRCSPVERLERRSPGSGMLLPHLSGIKSSAARPVAPMR